MGKRNPMLDKIELKWKTHYQNLFLMRIEMMLQMGQDAGMMAAYDVLGLGEDKAPEYAVSYRENITEMANVVKEDQIDDKQFWYAKDWRDKRIRLIVGEENFAPWEECYPGTK
ncbi:MAG: hypothetical protein IIV14_00740 [Bacteroidaceae bacterium]|nr:hypothetical protein [Bacteroidaceae bacterium]